MDKKNLDKAILISLGLIILLLSFFVLKPILAIIFLAFVLAYSLYPFYAFFFKKTKSKSFSAFLVSFILFFLILVPIVFLTPLLLKETMTLYNSAKEINITKEINFLFPSKFSEKTLQTIDNQFSVLTNNFFNSLINSFNSFLTTKLLSFLIGFAIFFFLFYYLIQNIEEISRELLLLIPLKKEVSEKFAHEFKNITLGIIYGQVLLGIVQGLLMGLFLYIINFQNVLFFTVVGIIAGILPLIGPSLVWIPVGIILLSKGQIILAIILVIYGSIVSWFFDGFVRPYIISERTVLSLPLSFVGMVGGVYSFGFLGLIIGPLVMSYLMLILSFYKEKKFADIFRE